MRKFFEPSVRLMNKIKYPQKFMLISLIFLATIFWLISLIVSNINKELELSKSELPGINYINSTINLIIDLQSHRGLSMAYLSGKKNLKDEILKIEKKIDEDIVIVDKLHNEFKEKQKIEEDLNEIKKDWNNIKLQTFNMRASESFMNHTYLINKNLAIIRFIGSYSNMVLDPDVGTTVIYRRLPLLIETVAKARDLSIAIILKGSFSKSEKRELLNLVSEFNYEFTILPSVIKNNFKKHPAMLNNILPYVENTKSKGVIYSKEIELIFKDETMTADFEEYFKKGTDIVSNMHDLFHKNINTLEVIIKNRIQRLNQDKIILVSIFFIVLFLTAYLFTGLYLSTMCTIHILEKVSREVAKGNLKAKAKIITQDELSKVGVSFNKMIQSLDEANENKTALMASLAHDIKSPIIAEQRALEAILSESFGDSLDNYREYLFDITKTNEEILILINNILAIYQYESEEYALNKESCSVEDVIHNSISSFKYLLSSEGSKLLIEIEENLPFVPMDKSEIKRVIMNFISNAIKHNPEKITISVVAKRIDNKVQVAVIDNGEGIEEEYQKDIFQKYPSHKRKIGTGLGLYLSKKVIDAHQGEIGFDTKKGKGTTFYFYLPIE